VIANADGPSSVVADLGQVDRLAPRASRAKRIVSVPLAAVEPSTDVSVLAAWMASRSVTRPSLVVVVGEGT